MLKINWLQEIKKTSHHMLIIIFFLSFMFLVANVTQAGSRIPKVKLSVKPLELSMPPSTGELMSAGQLGGQLYPTSDIKIDSRKPTGNTEKSKQIKAINLSFGKAIQAWNQHEYKKGVELFKKHIEEYPDSPWAGEAVLHSGCEARYNGRYQEAEDHFRWVIETNKDNNHIGAGMLVSKTRSRLGVLKVFQGNFDEAMKHFKILRQESLSWRDRTYASHWIQRLSKYKSNELSLLNCGVQALACVLKKDEKHTQAQEVMAMLPASLNGHSMKDLKALALRYGYAVTGLRLSVADLKKIHLPAVVQLTARNKGDKGHYWVLEKSGNNSLLFFDPQGGRRFHQSPDEFSREWSGNAFVFSDEKKLPGIRLTEDEMAHIYGGCCGNQRPEDNQGDPGQNEGPKNNKDNDCPKGAPKWSVNMVNMNLFVTDTPLWYSSPVGPPVQISLSYNSQSATAYNEPFGNKWQFNYGSYLVTDPGGTVTLFMPDGRRDIYMPDNSGNYTRPYQVYNRLTRIAENHFELRFPDDTVYVYNIPSGTGSLQPFLVEIRDAYGRSLTFGYNTDVQLTTITDALGRSTRLDYKTDGLVWQVTDPFGRSASFEYDANQNLTRITDMGGYWSGFTYDEDVYLTGIENERGKWEFYIEPADAILANSNNYPPPGDTMWENYRITVTNPLKGKEEYFYYGGFDDHADGYSWYVSPRDYITWQSQEINNFRLDTPKTRYFFTESDSGQGEEISRILYPEGGYIKYGYDAEGNRTSVTDSKGYAIAYTHNDMGRVTSVTDAKNIATDYIYADNGIDLKEIRNKLGTIYMDYNHAHDLTSVTDRRPAKTGFDYNSSGQMTLKTEAKGVLDIVTEYIYDESHHLREIKKDSKTVASYTYDNVGRVRTHTDATGLTLTYDYNDLNMTTKITHPDSKFVSYSYSGCCPYLQESVSDRAKRTTYYYYDDLRRLTDVKNPESGIISYKYDANGNMTKLIDANRNKTRFEYDLDNRLTKKIYADDKYVSFGYDSSGLVTSRINARKIQTVYTYDKNRNLETITYSDGTPGVTFVYDDYNRVEKRKDGIGTYIFGYNAESQMESVDGPWQNDTVIYQYDKLGRRESLSPQGGEAVSYKYDRLNRLKEIKPGADKYSYDYYDEGPLVENLIRPNGSVTTYQYDFLNRLTEISNKNSSDEIINKYVYGYNHQDMRSSETITNGNPITSFQNELVTYDYNKVNQLLSSTNPNRVFAYDDDGNMTQGYTPEGYVFTAGYDGENRLKSVEYVDNGGVVHKTEYYYSGDSFIAEEKKYENGSIVSHTRFVRDGLLALQERDGSNNVVREYVWGLNKGGGIGGLLNLRQGGQDYSYLYDGKGNVTSLIDSSQIIASAYTYDTFGNLMSESGNLTQPFKFSTKRYDNNIGVSYYGYRFYLSAFGRWMNRDPLGEKGGINLYRVVENNLINYLDPLGLSNTFEQQAFCPSNRNSPCRNTFPQCMRKCLNKMNSAWLVPISVGFGLEALLGTGAVAAEGTIIGTGLLGWGLGTSIGCSISCAMDRCNF
ncbi:MAG: hypothetical protein GY795_39620 [Desulfobacterales bacterium]|nr:hypothetical protein [Desulfobacterales bacterium]